MSNRIEAKGMNNLVALMKWLAVVSLALFIIKTAFLTESLLEIDVFGTILFLSPVFAYIIYRKQLESKKGQYIEWTDDTIQFKTKENESEIKIDSIKSIEIKVHKILIKTVDNNYEINIEDFKDFENRKELKYYFETLKIL